MADYITLAPSDLPKRLPLGPDQVYEHVNGNALFHEPALGVAPFTTSVALRYDEPRDRFHVEGGLRAVAEQDRLATQRGEGVVPGLDAAGHRGLRDRRRARRGAAVRAPRAPGRALDVFDAHYVNHLNSKNPFTGKQIPEPGRVLFVDLSVAF